MRKHFILFLLSILFQYSVTSQVSYFPPIAGDAWDTISPNSLGYCDEKVNELYDFLQANNTKGFILLKGGKIVLEKYFDEHTFTTPWYWASAGKSLTSFMVGMAQEDGYLSLDDISSDYLGLGWTNCSPEEEAEITIRDQLSMTTGLDDQTGDPYCTEPSCLLYKADAGSRWAYHNGPYTLLDQVIEAASGKNLNNYTSQKLKSSTGISGLYIKVDYNNVFWSTARVMARFGLLMQNKGNWNGKQIMTDSIYFYEMTHPSQDLNPSYGYLWWLNGYDKYMLPSTQFVFDGLLMPNAPPDLLTAMGKNGQFVNVAPSEDLVWVRIGNAPDELPVPYLLNDNIWEYINALKCTSIVGNDHDGFNSLTISPNPVYERLSFDSPHLIKQIRIWDRSSKLVKSLYLSANQAEIDFDLPEGVYIVSLIDKNGHSEYRKIFKAK